MGPQFNLVSKGSDAAVSRLATRRLDSGESVESVVWTSLAREDGTDYVRGASVVLGPFLAPFIVRANRQAGRRTGWPTATNMVCVVTTRRVLVWRSWPAFAGRAILGRYLGAIDRSDIEGVEVAAQSFATTCFRVSTRTGDLDLRARTQDRERLVLLPA